VMFFIRFFVTGSCAKRSHAGIVVFTQ